MSANDNKEDKSPTTATCISIQPGDNVQLPEITEGTVRAVLRDSYGLGEPTSIKKLAGYDDRNFHVKTRPIDGKEHSTEGYVLKFTNLEEGNVPGLVDGQAEYCLHLNKAGIPCPRIIPRKGDGLLWKKEQVTALSAEGNELKLEVPIRLFEFQPGKNVTVDNMTEKVIVQMGEMSAKIRLASKGFQHSVYETYKTLWSLSHTRLCLPFARYLPEQRQQDMVQKTLDNFSRIVTPIENTLASGQIHGDLNESNVLINSDGDLTGVLDLCDSHRCPYVYDVAIPTAYMMLLANETVRMERVPSLLYQGYQTICEITEKEFGIMYDLITARLCQSLVFGYYTYQQNPTNVYSAQTQKQGWKVYYELFENEDKWRRILSNKDQSKSA